MGKAWDARCRRWYGDRYDVRRNMVRGTRLGGTWGVAPGRGAGAHAACCVAPRLLNIQPLNTHTHHHHTTAIPRLTGTTTCGLWPMTRLAMTPQRAASSTTRTSGGARGPRHVPPYPAGGSAGHGLCCGLASPSQCPCSHRACISPAPPPRATQALAADRRRPRAARQHVRGGKPHHAHHSQGADQGVQRQVTGGWQSWCGPPSGEIACT